MIQACSRQYIRIKWASDIRLETMEGVVLHGQTTNVSSGGLEVVCDHSATNLIMPNGYSFDPEQPTVLSVVLSLGATGAALQARCHVKNMRRLAENAFALHLAFYELRPNNQQLLTNFVESEGVPR